MAKNTKPALSRKLANADAKARPIIDWLAERKETLAKADIPALVGLLNAEGVTAPRGGSVTYNVVVRALQRLEAERVSEPRMATPTRAEIEAENQRIRDAYLALSPEDRARADKDPLEWLEKGQVTRRGPHTGCA